MWIFCQERREEVIKYVQQKYGREQVAQIITFGTLQARAALRDVGRVLQMPYGQVDRICKTHPGKSRQSTHYCRGTKRRTPVARECETKMKRCVSC